MSGIEEARGQAGRHSLRGQSVHTLAPLRAGPSGRVRSERPGRMDPPGRRDGGRGGGAGPQLPLGSHPVPAPGRRSGESPPLVNVVRVRENGPLAVHAEADDRRPPRAAGDVVPLRPVGQQALLRRQPQGRQLHRDGRTRDHGVSAPADSQRPADDRARDQRPVADHRQPRALLGHRPHHQSLVEGGSLPLRSVWQQAVLRREPSSRGIRRAMRACRIALLSGAGRFRGNVPLWPHCNRPKTRPAARPVGER